MKALIDGDVLVYECAWGSQDRETGEIFSFDSVAERIDKKIADMLDATKSDSYQIYLTGKGNFREDIAVTKPYKGNRKQEKPFHYKNARVYLESLGAIVVYGMEADDAMAIELQAEFDKTISNMDFTKEDVKKVISTRDKDLRQVPGWHYGWEVGKQPEYAMRWVDELGEVELVDGNKKKDIKGTGLKFFYAQLITGDPVDNIPGLRLGGPVAAYEAVNPAESEEEMYDAVRALYKERAIKDHPHLGDTLDAFVDAQMLEQGRLLWMVRYLDDEGNPVMWELPN